MTETKPRPRVLVTRPSADAIPLAGELQRRGFDVLLQPLLRIETPDGPPLDLAGVQALLFTSANGVRAFARRSDVRTLAVYAVGDATAATAKAEGFQSVASACWRRSSTLSASFFATAAAAALSWASFSLRASSSLWAAAIFFASAACNAAASSARVSFLNGTW